MHWCNFRLTYVCYLAPGGSSFYGLFLLNYFNLYNLCFLFAFKDKIQRLISVCSAIFSLLFLLSNIETKTLGLSYPGQKIISKKQSPYGTIIVTSVNNQINLFENGILLSTTGDAINRESLAHFVMAQRPGAKNVLIIGGGYSGIIKEVKKYRTERIDYIDIDPELVKIIELLNPDFLSSAKIYHEDARKFLKNQKNKYDVILIFSPLPLSGSLNRFYTTEFFAELRNNLNSNGVIGFGITGSETYIGKELRALHSSIYRALRLVFKEILILPGQKIFYIAGDRPLTENIADKIKELKIKTEYVNEAYLKGRFTEERLVQAKNWVGAESRINYDLSPSAFRYYLDSWLKQFSSSKNYVLPAFIIFILIFFYILFDSKKPVLSYVSFTNGFSGISIEITLLLVFQVIYSTLYMDIGILFSAFMLGMAAGGFVTNKINKLDKVLFLSEISITLFPILIAILISVIDLHLISLHLARIIFFFLLFISGYIIGAQFYCLFPYASENPLESASGIYSADLIGSCAGAFLTGIFFIPEFGIVKTLILLTLLKLTSSFFLYAHLFGSKLTIPYRQWHLWVVMLLVITVTGLLIIDNNIQLYSFSKSNLQTLLFLGSILFALILSGNWLKIPLTNWFKLIQFLVLTLVAFYPVFRCFFKIPYLFCHVCPRQCAFGIYRKYIVLASTITNAGTWPFCHTTCPIGIMYDAQPLSEHRVSSSIIGKLHLIRFIVLILVPFVYFKAKFDEASLTPTFLDIYTFMFKNEFSISIAVILFALFFIFGGFVIPRFFCNLFCPIGAIKKLLERPRVNNFIQKYS